MPAEASHCRSKSSLEPGAMQLEEALQLVGEFGVFQRFLIAYLAVFMVPMRVIPMIAHIFMMLEPPHWCRQPELEELFNLTREEARELGVPREKDGTWSKCSMYEFNWTALQGLWYPGEQPNETLPPRELLPVVPCQSGWHYDHSVIYPTVVSEMDWVCGHTWKAYVSNSAFFGSMSVGVIVFGAISDKIGRVPVMVVVYVLAGIGAVATHFAQDFLVFLATRVIEGSVLLSISTIPFVLALEYVPAQKRMLMLSAFRFVYPLLGAAMPWVAYALAHWRLLNAVIMFPCFVGTIASMFTPESTRWLLSKGKTDKAKKILLRIGRINGKRVEKSAIDTLQPSDKSESAKSSTVDIFKYPSLRKSFVITLILWVMSCLAYQAGQLYASLATDNPFVVSSTTNAVDILAIGLAVPLADKWGRRPSTASAYAFAGLCYLAVAGFYGKSAAIFAALMAGRFALTAAYNVGYLYAAEIYPTEIRSQALSVRQAFGSLGKFLSSQVVQLAFYGRFLPLFVLGALSCASALITLPLPETNKKRLPETFGEAEAMHDLPRPCFPCCLSKKQRYNIPTISATTAVGKDHLAPHIDQPWTGDNDLPR
ncbi:solute carrier family 22 member 6-like [Amblyomma americanum]